MPRFALYPVERHWCSFADYGAILDVVRRLQPKIILEFGPGSSTLALIEGGAECIDCCEDNPHWLSVHRARILYPNVAFHAFEQADPLSITAIDGNRYDLALIDGPLEKSDRFPVIRYCLARSAAVLVALECMGGDTTLIDFVFGLNATTVETIETGPLAGAFALLTP